MRAFWIILAFLVGFQLGREDAQHGREIGLQAGKEVRKMFFERDQ